MAKISAVESLSGSLSAQKCLTGSLSADNTLTGVLSVEDVSDPYIGPYVVTPDTKNDIVLKINNKKMIQDMVVEKIPYRVNDNLSDGLTVYIGE